MRMALKPFSEEKGEREDEEENRRVAGQVEEPPDPSTVSIM